MSKIEVQPSMSPPGFTMIDCTATSLALQLNVSPVESSRHVWAKARVASSKTTTAVPPSRRPIMEPDIYK